MKVQPWAVSIERPPDPIHNEKEEGMAKKIAVLVRDRQGEAIRVGVGLTLADDTVELFVLDRKVEETEGNTMNLELMKDMDIKVYTNSRENPDLEYLSTEEIAGKLLEYDNILPY